MLYLDANIVLRYILGDDDELSNAAKEIIENSNIFVTSEVLAEVIYVLSGVYAVSREDIRTALLTFFADSACGLVNHIVILKALDIYSGSGLDFVDCVLAAHAITGGAEVATFDKELQRYIEDFVE